MNADKKTTGSSVARVLPWYIMPLGRPLIVAGLVLVAAGLLLTFTPSALPSAGGSFRTPFTPGSSPENRAGWGGLLIGQRVHARSVVALGAVDFQPVLAAQDGRSDNRTDWLPSVRKC